MAEIVRQNPGSEEVQSPLIAGLTEGLNKLSHSLNLEVGQLSDERLFPVAVDSQPENKNRIYEIQFGKKLWLASPTPVIKKNGVVISKSGVPHTVDLIGGSVTFKSGLSDGDKVTVTCQYITGSSTTLNTLSNLLQEVSDKADRYKGEFDTAETLSSTNPKSRKGDFAFVDKPSFAIYVWDTVGSKWAVAQSMSDLLKGYAKTEDVDRKLGEKEPNISPSGRQTDYLDGNKTWQDITSVVRGTTLKGFSANNEKVSATDTFLQAVGKLQGQIDKKQSWLSGWGAPTNNTVGIKGQRYVNIANGEWYTLTFTNGSPNGYVWERGVNEEDINGVMKEVVYKGTRKNSVKDSDSLGGLSAKAYLLEANLKKEILDMFFPIGFTICVDNTSFDPNSSWGGTWERVQGKFLIGADEKHPCGSTGGSLSKKIVSKNLPEDTITLVKPGAHKWSTGKWSNVDELTQDDFAAVPLNQNGENNGGAGVGYNVPLDVTPPYLALYIWKRTA